MASAPGVQVSSTVPIPPGQREVRIYSHSPLLYWWPVWAVGVLCAILTFADGHRMALVPVDTAAESGRIVQGHESAGPVDVLIVPKGQALPKDESRELVQPHLRMAHSKNLGVVWAAVLILTIVVTNIPLRGLWSVILLLFIVLIVVFFALLGWWDPILERLSLLDIRVNEGGYLFISGVLFLIWVLTIFVFDLRSYVSVTPGQVRVCTAGGARETAYDATGLTFDKQQNDFFRHWIVGLGSGDLVLHLPNSRQDIDLPNVLFVGAKAREIDQLIKERPVV